MTTQVTIKVPAEARYTLLVAYKALLSLGKVLPEATPLFPGEAFSSTASLLTSAVVLAKAPPYIDTTLLFASAHLLPSAHCRECDCLITVNELEENKCELCFTCDLTAGNMTGKGMVVQFIASFLKKFSQMLSEGT